MDVKPIDGNYNPDEETVVIYAPEGEEPMVMLGGDKEPKVFENHKKAARHVANNVQAAYRKDLFYANSEKVLRA